MKLLEIGTKVLYKGILCEIVEYSHIDEGKYYVVQPVGESAYYQRIVRYDDGNLEAIK